MNDVLVAAGVIKADTSDKLIGVFGVAIESYIQLPTVGPGAICNQPVPVAGLLVLLFMVE